MIAMVISHHKERDTGNGLDRVSEHTLMHKLHRNHNLNRWILHNLMMYQMRTSQMWILRLHQLDHHHQLNREVAPDEPKDLDRMSVQLHIHLRRTQMKIQQPWIHKIAWATVDSHHKNKKAHEAKVHKNRREGKLLLKSNRGEPPKAKKHKSIDSDEDDEETRNETGTSSNSQPAAPVLPYYSGDEDSEYSDEYSAQSRDSERT